MSRMRGGGGFLEAALNTKTGRIAKRIECTHCGAVATKEKMDLLFETFWDQTHPAGWNGVQDGFRCSSTTRRRGVPQSKRTTKQIEAHDTASDNRESKPSGSRFVFRQPHDASQIAK